MLLCRTIARHCEAIEDSVEKIVDLYLHGYDLEESCVSISQCKPRMLGVRDAVKAFGLD